LGIASVLALAPPLIIARIIDYFVAGNTAFVPFYWYLGALLGVMIADNVISLGTKHYFNLLIIKIQKQAKVEAMENVLQGDLLWHDTENTGNKMQRVSEGEKAIEGFLRFYINQGISMVVTLIGIISVFAFFNYIYAVIAVVYLTIYIFAEYKLNKKVAKKVYQIKIAQEQATGKAYEFSSNIETVKSLGIEKSTQSQIKDIEQTVLVARNEKRKASTQKWIVVELISVLFFIIFMFIIGRDVIAGAITVGAIVVYVDYMRRLGGTLNFLSNVINFVIEMKFGLFRMMQIFNAVPSYNEDHAHALKSWDTVTLKNVKFKYKNEGVLEDISLTIKKGQKIGIVGSSGSGKSTLFKLLLKLYLPQKGEIKYDDVPIQDLTRESILKKVAIVPQETELFNLSLKDNITIAETNSINPGQYLKAVQISQTNKTISKMQDKDLTVIGEKGVRLSGGERQRLGIARAIYKDSDIIIFDEATSNLDYETEKNILNAMDSRLKGKTLIIAAHRLETLRGMDTILFIEKGKIVEQGTYSELEKANGKFARLLKEQHRKKK